MDWVQSITDSSENSFGVIIVDVDEAKNVYLKYEDGEIVGGQGMELEYYDLEVEQVKVSTNPCTDKMINYQLYIKEQ